MTADYLIDVFKGCEYLDDFAIGVDFLDSAVNTASIVPEGERIIRKYCDGQKLTGYEFSLVVRLSAKEMKNCENSALMEKLTDWIKDFSPCGVSEDFRGTPIGITVNNGAVLDEDNIHSLEYRIKCTLNILS